MVARRLDPRTTLVLLLVGNVVLFSAGFAGRDLAVRACFMALPLVMLGLAGRWWALAVSAAVTGAAFGLESVALAVNTPLALAGAAALGLVTRVLPAAMYGYAFLVTTRVSDLMAALERAHLPRAIVIPLAVVVRFLPTAAEEDRAVAAAMRVRGLSLRAVGVSGWLEYRFVPLIVSTVKSGEELAQAALTRGLGAPVRAERIARVGFGVWDGVLLAAALAGLLAWVWP